MKYSSRWFNPYNRGMGRPNTVPRSEMKNRLITNMHLLHKKAYFDTLKYLEILEKEDEK